VKEGGGAEGECERGAYIEVGPVRNPILNTGCACFPWFLSFGNRTQNSRVPGAGSNYQADRGSDPNHRGIWSPPRAGLGPVRNPVL